MFRCFGVSVFRCFGVSVFRCFGVSVFHSTCLSFSRESEEPAAKHVATGDLVDQPGPRRARCGRLPAGVVRRGWGTVGALVV